MSDCGVCIGGGDYDGSNEFENISTPKARKEHQCCECSKIIVKGEVYHYWAAKFDGEMGYQKTCMVCAEIREAFSCDGAWPMFGEMWNEVREYMFPLITTGCYEKLTTPEAKAELQRRWMAWKGLTATPVAKS